MDAVRKQALDQFLAGVEGRAYRMAYLATSDRDEALDLVQEAMLRLVKRYGERAAEEWPPLFYRILQNQIQDHHRRRKVRHFVRGWLGGEQNEAMPAAWDVAPAPGPQAQARQGEAMEALGQALQALPQRQQQVVLLRVWEGLDVADTARAMSCSQGSVKTHYSRAVAKLREILGECWP